MLFREHMVSLPVFTQTQSKKIITRILRVYFKKCYPSLPASLGLYLSNDFKSTIRVTIFWNTSPITFSLLSISLSCHCGYENPQTNIERAGERPLCPQKCLFHCTCATKKTLNSTIFKKATSVKLVVRSAWFLLFGCCKTSWLPESGIIS